MPTDSMYKQGISSNEKAVLRTPCDTTTAAALQAHIFANFKIHASSRLMQGWCRSSPDPTGRQQQCEQLYPNDDLF